MNLDNKAQKYTASMLVTRDGYMVKVHKLLEDNDYKKICFFVNENFEHHLWKLTKTKGMPVQASEYYRLKNKLFLEQIGLNTKQFEAAVIIAEIVEADPYYGLDEAIKDAYLKDNVLDKYPVQNRIYFKAIEKEKRQPAVKEEVAAVVAPAEIEKPVVQTKKSQREEKVREVKKSAVFSNIKIATGFEGLAALLSA